MNLVHWGGGEIEIEKNNPVGISSWGPLVFSRITRCCPFTLLYPETIGHLLRTWCRSKMSPSGVEDLYSNN
jgi:hypothetical protein